MNTSTDMPGVSIECPTCPATGTTACGDCVITHLLANDDGPIEYEPTDATHPVAVVPAPEHPEPHAVGAGARAAHGRLADVDRVIQLFAAAGLLDDPPLLIAPGAFERGLPDPPALPRDLAGSTRR